MADVLLNKVINEEIPSKLFIKWILKAVPENEGDFKEISACNVGQIDFITYFLNFIHVEVPCKLSETSQEPNTSKRIDAEGIQSQPLTVQDPNFNFDAGLDNSLGNISTPKIAKNNPGNKNDYFSPISPLYQNPIQNNFGPKETKHARGNRKSADKYSICLGDFLVTPSSSKKRKQHVEQECSEKGVTRRIKPTSICLKQANNGFQKTENSFNFQENIEEVPVKTAVEQRNILVEERIKMLSRKDSTEHTGFPTLLKRHNSLSKSDVQPILSMVTYKSNMNHVIDIYKTILDYKLVLNITNEIYFLISLFLTRQAVRSQQNSRRLTVGDHDQEDHSCLGVDYLDSNSRLLNSIENSGELTDVTLHNLEIFESIHNVVYFAVKCLESQIKIVKFYDKTTIKLLGENERMKEFSQALSKNLLAFAAKKAERQCIGIETPISQANVCFNIDTDNKDNFVDIFGFQTFRKQRDLFYEILRVWETHHLATDWNFALGLGGKIRSLFNFQVGPTNYMHLARLFKSQLLSSCARGPKEKGLSENNISFLPSLAIDAEKLNRLTNRLVTKQDSNGINSLPVFSGYQEFFKDFIVMASNYFFNRHLCDIMISEIIELNDTKFSDMALEEEGNEVDQNTRKLYINCIKNLRILAKFLGFIESLPYQSDVQTFPKNVLEAQLKLREQSVPLLNIKSLLESAIERHTVVLIVPWLTKYLAVLDYTTLRLPYYMSVHVMLFELYRNYDESETSGDNAAVVKFCLGWLFELPHFPDVEFFNYCSKIIDKSQFRVCLNGIKIDRVKAKYLDYMTIVDQSVLYLCCPYLEEIKKLLTTNAPGSKITVRYITPVTAVESNVEIARQKLEQQLEEAFFSAQPSSLRKTVEFVSERVASTSVKYICHELVPTAKQLVIKDLRENVLKYDDEDYEDLKQRKMVLRKLASTLAQSHLTTFLQSCNEEVRRISRQRIPLAIDSLLPVDALEETKKTCIGITDKLYAERVQQWINGHVNLSVFTKDFDNEIKKVCYGKQSDKEKVAFILPSSGRSCEHIEDTLSGFHALNKIREACCKVTEGGDITSDFVLNVLQETYQTLTQRNDVNDTITETISMTIFDFCLLLVAGFPTLFSKTNYDLADNFVEIWSHQPKSNSMFKALFCPRNVNLLQFSNKKEETWESYARIVTCLLDNELIGEDDLESQCYGFFRRDWDQDTLNRFEDDFLRKLVKFACLVNFLSDFCLCLDDR